MAGPAVAPAAVGGFDPAAAVAAAAAADVGAVAAVIPTPADGPTVDAARLASDSYLPAMDVCSGLDPMGRLIALLVACGALAVVAGGPWRLGG